MISIGGLPIVPDVSCPSAAGALAGAGLGTVCSAASSVVKGVVGSAASQLAGLGVDSVLDALGSWVSAGATWLLSQIGSVITGTTSIDLGASWFTSHYQTMMALAGVVIVPMLLLGIMQSVYRQNGSALVRSVIVNVPLALLLTAVAVKLVELGLTITDAMSDTISAGAGLNTGQFLSAVALGLSVSAVVQPSVPAFVMFIGGLAVVFGALMVWIELLIRAAAVYVAVLFLPLVLASLAWPAISHWCRRLVDTLVALILGKFVIVAVLSLAAGALAGGVGASTSSSGAGGGGGGGGFAAVLGGAALLLLASFAPWALFRLLPFLEAGAVGHLEAISHRARHAAAAPIRGLAVVAMRSEVAGSVLGGARGMNGLLGSAGALGSGGGGDGGPGGHGDMGGSSPPGGPGDPGGGADGGAGPTGRPEPEPSSAELTGVGTMRSPGHGIPMWADDHPPPPRTDRHIQGKFGAGVPGASRSGDEDHRGPTDGLTPGRSGVDPDGPDGTVGVIGRDELGARLVSVPPASPRDLPAPTRPPSGAHQANAIPTGTDRPFPTAPTALTVPPTEDEDRVR